MDILNLMEVFAPDHVQHMGAFKDFDQEGGDVHVKCPCNVRLTFLGVEIAKLDPVVKAEIAFQVGTRGATSGVFQAPPDAPADERATFTVRKLVTDEGGA